MLKGPQNLNLTLSSDADVPPSRFIGEPKMRIISLGAGVQSSVMALMAARGDLKDENGKRLPRPDYAIFADTGWEPRSVYTHLKWLKREIEFQKYPFEIIEAKRDWGRQGRPDSRRTWQIQKHLLAGKNSTGQDFITVPVFILNKDGKKGIARRQCTREYKLEPIRRKIRALCDLKFRQPMPRHEWVEQWIGISQDEITRMKDSREPWLKSRWPLIEMLKSRSDCIKWFKKRYPDRDLPRSACIGCPMHTDGEWLDMARNDPESWAEAVKTDRALRRGSRRKKFGGELYLHRSMKPLNEIDFEETQHEKQVSLNDECEGMCGM